MDIEHPRAQQGTNTDRKSTDDRNASPEVQEIDKLEQPEWPVFAWADQAEVIRASQKDDYYVRQLKGMAEDVAEHALGGQALSR
jgi:hypothetical protein